MWTVPIANYNHFVIDACTYGTNFLHFAVTVIRLKRPLLMVLIEVSGDSVADKAELIVMSWIQLSGPTSAISVLSPDFDIVEFREFRVDGFWQFRVAIENVIGGAENACASCIQRPDHPKHRER
jgi:hypothetical protein